MLLCRTGLDKNLLTIGQTNNDQMPMIKVINPKKYPPTPAYAKAGAAPGIAVGVKLAAGFALALPWPLRTGLVTVFSAGLGTR